MQYQSVLIAIEPNRQAEQILASAVRIGPHADLHVIYVAPSVEQEYEIVTAPSVVSLIDEFTRDARRWAGQEISNILQRCDVLPNSVEVTFGSPAEQILLATDKLCADLVVIGAHNGKGLQLLGTVASKIEHNAPCDVLTVFPEA